MSVRRIFVEKKPDYAVKAGELREELESYLENTIESMGDLSKKWIIENGDSMPPCVSLDKLRLIIEVAKRHTF